MTVQPKHPITLFRISTDSNPATAKRAPVKTINKHAAVATKGVPFVTKTKPITSGKGSGNIKPEPKPTGVTMGNTNAVPSATKDRINGVVQKTKETGPPIKPDNKKELTPKANTKLSTQSPFKAVTKEIDTSNMKSKPMTQGSSATRDTLNVVESRQVTTHVPAVTRDTSSLGTKADGRPLIQTKASVMPPQSTSISRKKTVAGTKGFTAESFSATTTTITTSTTTKTTPVTRTATTVATTITTG